MMKTESFVGRPFLLIGLAASFAMGNAFGFTEEDADAMLKAHLDAFYQEEDGKAWFRESTEGGVVSFWMRAEQMEMILDAYEKTEDKKYLDMFEKLFHGFVDDHGEDWSHNDFNDDIMWIVIACTRAHLLSGNEVFLETARANFDRCYKRAWSEDLGGGLWWKTDRNFKNACVNAPGSIAASLLAEATGEEAYAEKARATFDWLCETLVDPETSRVNDHIRRRDGGLNRRCFSYNMGTYVGAAHCLGETERAREGALYTINELSEDGILPGHGERGDGGGFNGICLRWIERFAEDQEDAEVYEEWLQKNAQAAWDVRRESDGLSWSQWDEQTPEGERYSWGASSSVMALLMAEPTE